VADHPENLAERYTAELRKYLAEAGEAPLRSAYELGRRAFAEGLGVLEMAATHHDALATIAAELRPAERAQAAAWAAAFFTESLSPFEMALRGFQEANAALRRNVDDLSAAERELSARNQRLAEAHRAVEAGRRRYRELFEFAPDGYVVTDLEGVIQEANNSAALLFRAPQDSLAGTPLLLFVAGEDHLAFRELLAQLQNSHPEKLDNWEIRMQPRCSPAFPAAITVAVVREHDSRPAGLRWLLRDITERRLAEEESARLLVRERVADAEQQAARRLEFLAEASRLLAASLDYEKSFAAVARLAVPSLADWCFVYLVEHDGAVRRLPPAHSDAAQAELAGSSVCSYARGGPLPGCVAQVLATGRPEMLPDITPEWLDNHCGDREVFRQIGVRSALTVPLAAEDTTVGAITFAMAESGRRYSDVDLSLAEDLAHRCSLALENARLYREMIAERDKAEKASRAKDEFVAILSHELRNPLMPILGWTRVLKSQKALTQDPLISEGVKSLERNAHNIERIVSDCLDLARISERKIKLERELVDLNQVAEASIEAVREMAQAKGLKFLVQLAPVTLRVWGDRTRLQQVVMNLLTNAVKYTDTGGLVWISSHALHDAAILEVQDTGIGIASDFLNQIFEPFRQGSSAWLQSESGLGVGLAVVHQIVNVHGGSISAESPGPGCGSTFRLRLPLAAPQSAERESAGRQVAAAPAPTGLRVLVIEDSHDILRLLRLELEAIGYSVLTAEGGETGLDVALRRHPDVIISDIRMPGMDGYEFIRRLRQLPELAATPAIALTGFGMSSDIEKAKAAGYDAHATKPVDPSDLSALIEQLAAKRRVPSPACCDTSSGK
jgi:PAS domain S-box-containing protein